MKKRSKAAAAVIAVMLLGCSMIFTGCGTDDIDISQYENSKILLSGLSQKEESVTIGQLKELKCITKKTHSTSDKIGEVRATGPLLDTLLEKYGVSQTDFSKIKIYGEDEYDITLRKEFLEENKVILAFGIDGEPLDPESKPLRIIIPESDSAYWIRMVNKIEFIK